MTELHVGVDARLVSGHFGGVEQTIIGLAYGFSQLEDGDEVYHFLVHEDADRWLVPYLQGRCRPLYMVNRANADSVRSVVMTTISWLAEDGTQLLQFWIASGAATCFRRCN